MSVRYSPFLLSGIVVFLGVKGFNFIERWFTYRPATMEELKEALK